MSAPAWVLGAPPTTPAPPTTGTQPTGAGITRYQDQTPQSNPSATIDQNAKVSFPTQDIACNDFGIFSNYGFGFRTAYTLLGSGRGFTRFRMNPHTSTKAAIVNALTVGQTNPYHLMQAGTNVSGDGTGPTVTWKDFDLVGEDEGHLYGGGRIDYSHSPVVQRVNFYGFPGSRSGSPSYAQPPGETFGALNLFRCTDALIDTCDMDGRRAGVRVACSLLGNNNSDRTVLNSCYVHDTGYGFGLAFWQSTSGDINNTHFDHNYDCPVHIEKCDGTWNLRNCVWTNTQTTGENGGHLQLNPQNSNAYWRTGQCVVNIYDPVYDDVRGDGKFHITLRNPTGYPQQNTKGSGTTPGAFNLYIGGVLTPSLLSINNA